ncbi:hypothetical protein KAR91_24550, partial [Candidatus Pacearchaeota archaeon]|nr:hypothetical protein [Candidatus Pacearchaeota archaeon]
MSNGVAKPGGEEFEVVEETDIVEIPDNDILSSTVDGDKEVDQNILYPDDIEYILAKLNYLCEKSEVLIHRLQILKYSQNANDGGHDAGGVIEILREMQTIQKSLEEYIQAREIRGPMGQFINLNQEIRILILEGGISEGEVSFLVNAIEGLKDYFELEREKSLENAAEQGLYFSRSFNELVQKIQGVRADIWRNGVDLVDGNSALISYVKEAQKMTQALKKNDKLSSYVKSNVLNPIIDIIDSLVRSDQPALDLADTGIGTFQKKISQLINF